MYRVVERDAAQRTRLRVHRRLPQLVRVHFAETLEAADVDLGVRVILAHLGAYLVALLVGVCHALGLAARELIERRHRGIDIAALDKRTHVAEEEGQQQRADM